MFLRESLPSDATLVAQALSSEPAAFERLVLRYQRKAFAIARALGVAPSSVDDVVQESFLQAFCGLRELRSPASFGPWFLTIVRNISRKEIESSRRPIDPLRLEPRLEPEPPADATDLEEMREHVWREVQCLPEGIREAIFLYYHEGESVRRVAQTLELSASAVKSRLQRGRDQLRQRLWRELEDSLREMLPSTREWKQRGRRLTLLLLAAASSEKVLAGAEAAAPSSVPSSTPSSASSSGSLVHAVTTGALLMSIKKLFLGAGLAALLLAASLAIVSRSFHRPSVDGRKLADSGQLTPPAGPADPAQSVPEKPAASPTPAARRVTGVTGTVFLESAPTPAADVFVAAILDGERSHAKEVTTGADGNYTLADLKPGKYLVWAWKDDWTTHSPWSTDHEVEIRDGELAAAKELTLVPGVIVEGRVVEEGTNRPIPFASASFTPVQFAKADDEGHFRLEGLPDGLISISAKADGHSPRSQEIDVAHGELPSVEIALSRGGIIEGNVKDLAGTAAAGVDVTAGGGSARTDGEGRFEIDGIPLTARTIELTASRDGRFAVQDTLSGFAAGEARIVHDLQLDVGHVLRGRVLDEAGQPIAGAKIEIFGSMIFRGCSSDGEGRFVIEGASERMFTLSVGKKGSAPVSLNLRDLPTEDRENIELVLGKSHFVEGTVVDEQGDPVERATVYVEPNDRSRNVISTKTDAIGHFRVEDLPEKLREIGVQKKGFANNRFNAVKADQRDVRLVLREAGQIQGVVVDKARGAAVHPFVVKVSFARGSFHEKNKEKGFGGGLSASLGREGLPFEFSNGQFKIRNDLAPGIFYALLVVAPGYGEAVLDGVEAWPLSESREPVRVEVEKGNALRGRVLAAATRDPVAGVKVSHLTESGNTGRGYWHERRREEDTAVRVSITDSEGSFVIEGLPPTPGVLLLEKPGFARTTVRRAAPSPQIQVFELTLASAIQGSVRNAAGDPLKGTDVAVSVEAEGFPGATTDARGFYKIDGLPGGSAEVVLRQPGHLEKHRSATLSPGEVTALDFTFSSGAVLVRVSDGGKPVAQAQVLVKSLKDTREQQWVTADDEGRSRIDGMDPGSYELKASRPDTTDIFGGVRQTIEVGNGETACEISLARAGGLSGRVVDRNTGNAARGAKVTLFQHAPGLFSAGGFKFTGSEWLPAGGCAAEGDYARFQMKVSAAGSYLLLAQVGEGSANQGWLGPLVLDAGGQADDLTIQVGGPSSLAVTVRDAKTGAPIEGTGIVLRPGEGDSYPAGLFAKTDASGIAQLSNAAPGKYRLEVQPADHLPHFEEVVLDEAPLAREVSLEPASWITVELSGSVKQTSVCQVKATLVSGGDPAWSFSTLDGKSLGFASTQRTPHAAPDSKLRLMTRAGRYTIRFEVGPSLGVPPLLSQDLDVDVPREGEVTVRLLLPEK